MAGYGQFCAVARAHEVLGGRWTLLVVRELLCGSRRFNDLHRGVPRMSTSLLTQRLRRLEEFGIVRRDAAGKVWEYSLTEAGEALRPIVMALGHWGQRWLPRRAEAEDLDLEPVLVDLRRRVDFDALPRDPMVVRFEIRGHPQHFLLLTPAEASLCTHNPGFPEPLCVQGPLAALVAWWRGDAGFAEARRMGLAVQGPRPLARAFPGWFLRYQLAGIAPAEHGA